MPLPPGMVRVEVRLRYTFQCLSGSAFEAAIKDNGWRMRTAEWCHMEPDRL